MRPLYENIESNLEIMAKKSSHIFPHIHKSIECVLVTKGSLELGIERNLLHMEQGDFAIVFPDLIHHYQVFDSGECTSSYLLAVPSLAGGYLPALQQYVPQNPIISKNNVHPDILYAMKSLMDYPAVSNETNQILHQAFLQIILSRSLPLLTLQERNTSRSNDIIFDTVSYIARYFQENVTLTKMAKDLGISQYALSRVFSSTFHMNFNQYLNETRLDYACNLLQFSNESITEIYENAGFESQRTFNRVFKERFRMSPREYRTLMHRNL